MRKNPQMPGKKRSKIGHLASILNAADADFDQKHRRNAADYTPYRPSEKYNRFQTACYGRLFKKTISA